MSKGNMLLGHARGKVGDLVFSRNNGQQVVRARAAVVKNPQTEAQMIQRIILATVAQAYSRMSEICDHSFEGVPSGQKCASFFNKVNMDRLRTSIAQEIASGGDLSSVYAFTPIGSQVYASNNFVIAKGSLPEVGVTFTGSTLAVVSLPANTYQAVIDAYGLQRGDQLTFVSTQGISGESTVFKFARVILDPQNADGSQANLSVPFIVDDAINLPNQRNEGEFSSLTFAASQLSYAFSAQPMSGAAVIVSRKKADGSWQRSNAVLAVNDVAIAGFMLSMQDCLDLFASGGLDTLSDLYLNNAGSGRLATEGDGYDSKVVALSLNGDHLSLDGDNSIGAGALTSVDGYVVAGPIASEGSFDLVIKKVDAGGSGSVIASATANGILRQAESLPTLAAGAYVIFGRDAYTSRVLTADVSVTVVAA